MKRSGEGCMNMANQGCLLPLLRRRVSGKGRSGKINGDDEDDDLEFTQNIVNSPMKELSESEVHNKPKPPKRVNFRQETKISDSVSARLSLAKLVAILRDAYVCTMMSFATKGGMGAVTMGGNINLQSAVPTSSVKADIVTS